MCKGTFSLPYSPYELYTRTTGQELTRYLDANDTEFDRIIYIGDGSNDFCAVLRLRRYVPSSRRATRYTRLIPSCTR